MAEKPPEQTTEERRADCGHLASPSFMWERQGRTMCEICFGAWLRTPAGRAYEAWYVRD
jgi:hypothetical protein